MAISPQTNLFLLKNKLTLDYKNQLTFASKQAQFNYFHNLPKIEIDNISYIRKDSIIRYPEHIDNLLEYNYCMYQNENYGNKWFYAFIVNMRYINDNMTEITIATDVFQTWQFDIQFKESFVEREMINVADDIPGANLLNEGLETGEFKVGGTANFNELMPIAVIAYTRNPYDDGLTNQQPSALGVQVNGIPNGMYFCVCSFYYLQGVLSSINNSGHGDAIMTIFTIPAFALIGFNNWTLEDITEGLGVMWWVVNDIKAPKHTINLVSTPSSLDGYTPRNQKLRTYPFMYLGFNPTNGNSKIYRYEDFQNGTPIFDMYSEINQNPTICFIPQNYRGSNGDGMSDLVTLQGYPTLGWITEYYNTWLAQNSNIINLKMEREQMNYEYNVAGQKAGQVGQVVGAVGSGISGNYGAAAQSGFNVGIEQGMMGQTEMNHFYNIYDMMAQKEKQAMLPNQGSLAGSNATLLGYDLMDNNIFTRYTIKRQYAERIDKFFDMFGYMTNKIKIPNLNNRPKWNYIKTEGANILGNIPQLDLQLIKNMFDNGVTLWHDTTTFLDYSQNNR